MAVFEIPEIPSLLILLDRTRVKERTIVRNRNTMRVPAVGWIVIISIGPLLNSVVTARPHPQPGQTNPIFLKGHS